MRLTKTHRRHLRALLHPEARLLIMPAQAPRAGAHRNRRGQVWWLYPRGLAGGDPRRLCGLTPDAIEHVCGSVQGYLWRRTAKVEGGVVVKLTPVGLTLLREWLQLKPTVVWRRQA